jgi:hypothetical protein
LGKEAGGGKDLVREGGGESSSDEDEDPLTPEREHLIPLISPIVNKWRKWVKM